MEPFQTTPIHIISFHCLFTSCDEPAIGKHVGRVCFCDDQCELYNDCCYDANPTTKFNNSLSHIFEHVTCQQTNFELNQLRNNTNVHTATEAFLMVSSCPSEWISTQRNRKIAEEIFFKCSNSSLLPRTDPSTNFTFHNIYCAQCYNIDLKNLVVWQPEYSCDINTTLDAKNLQLRTLEDVAKVCKLLKYAPSLNLLTRHCLPHVSTCPNQTDINARKCQTEGLELYQEGLSSDDYVRLFRNSYCADCNGVDVPKRSCFTVLPLINSVPNG